MPIAKCRICKSSFAKRSMSHVACGPDCAEAVSIAKREKESRKQAKKERQDIKARKDAIKTRADWIKEAQTVFNQWVRLRDQLVGHPCISSGRPLDWSGNGVDAGHYRSVGSAPHLRFDERNVHAQSKQDNRYGAGAAVEYRIGLIKRIGLEQVEALESSHEHRKFTIDELKSIKEKYKIKLKLLQEAYNAIHV